MKICPVRTELLHADGRTDEWTYWHDELRVAFRNFVKAPTNCRKITDAQTVTSTEPRPCAVFALQNISCETIFPK